MMIKKFFWTNDDKHSKYSNTRKYREFFSMPIDKMNAVAASCPGKIVEGAA
jgi:hypothetical protein